MSDTGTPAGRLSGEDAARQRENLCEAYVLAGVALEAAALIEGFADGPQLRLSDGRVTDLAALGMSNGDAARIIGNRIRQMLEERRRDTRALITGPYGVTNEQLADFEARWRAMHGVDEPESPADAEAPAPAPPRPSGRPEDLGGMNQ